MNEYNNELDISDMNFVELLKFLRFLSDFENIQWTLNDMNEYGIDMNKINTVIFDEQADAIKIKLLYF